MSSARLDPNRFAAPLEAEILRGHIEADEKELHALCGRLSRAGTILHDAARRRIEAQEAEEAARTMVEDLKDIKAELEHRIRKMRGKLHPVKLVPLDIWQTVFLLATEAEFEDMEYELPHGWDIVATPFVVCKVCRHWRSAATSTPALWTRLVFDYKRMQNYEAWIPYFQAALTFSASRDLTLKIICDGPQRSRTLASVVDYSIIPRCKRVELELHPGGDYLEVCSEWRTASQLVELVIENGELDYHPETLVGNIAVALPADAPFLKRIESDRVVIVPALHSGKILPALTHLKYTAFVSSNVSELTLPIGLQPFMTNLQSLTFHSPVLMGDLNGVPIVWPGIKHVALSTRTAPEETALAFRFPDLQHLEVTHAPEVSWDFWCHLAMTACPAVRELTLRRLPSVVAKPAVAKMSSLGNVTTLTFADGQLDHSACSALLANEEDGVLRWSFPRLAKVFFEDALLTPNFELEHLREAIITRRDAYSTSPQVQARVSLAGMETRSDQLQFRASATSDGHVVTLDRGRHIEDG